MATSAVADTSKNPSQKKNQNKTPSTETTPEKNQCDAYLNFPIGESSKKLSDKWGEPESIRDISAISYTWRVDDNFITLLYEKDNLISVEIDHKCSEEPNKACAVYDEYKKAWPAYESVELEYGKPVEKVKVPREEWLYKNETESVYFELQRDQVVDIECIPTVFITVKEKPKQAERPKPAPKEKEEKHFDPREYYKPDDYLDNPDYYDDSLEYEDNE